MNQVTWKLLAVPAARDTIALNLADGERDSGITLATVHADRYTTAGGYTATRPDTPVANILAASPDLLACAMEYERTPPDVRATAAWHTPWYGRLTVAIAKAKGGAS